MAGIGVPFVSEFFPPVPEIWFGLVLTCLFGILMKPIFNVGAGAEVENHQTGTTTQYLNGIVDPSVAPGVEAPISSQYTRDQDNGDGTHTITIYTKFGPAATDWRAQANDGTLGAPSDGVWSDGLFAFNAQTPVGSAVDRLNEVLARMAPPQAPSLTMLGSAQVGASGKLSFGSANPIAGYFYDANPINTAVAPVGGTTLGLFSGQVAITGDLQYGLAANASNAWPAKAFGPGDDGVLELWVNGVKAHSVNLASFLSGVSMTAGTGFTLSGATPVKFANGNDFPDLLYRTGSFTVAVAGQRPGYNYAEIKHVVGDNTTTNKVAWYNSTDTTALVGSDYSLVPTFTGTRWLSGVQFFNAGTLNLKATVKNAYRDVYSGLANAVSFVNPASVTFSASALPATTSNTADLNADLTAAVNASQRMVNASVSVTMSVAHPLKAQFSTPAITSGTMLFDSVSTSAALVEDFNTEGYRVPSAHNPTAAGATPPTFDSTLSILGAGELQVVNGRLVYPTQDFRSKQEGGSTLDYSASGNPNYAGATGMRTFVRSFQNTSGATRANFKLNLAGSGTTFSDAAGSGVSMEVKFPQGSLSAGTGWMDAFKDFTTAQWGDGAGCRASNQGAGRALATDWGITVGTQSIAANERVYVRIKAPASWAGYIDSMSLTWL